MKSTNETELKDIEEMYIDFKNMTYEQKLKFEGFYLAMCMLKVHKETA